MSNEYAELYIYVEMISSRLMGMIWYHIYNFDLEASDINLVNYWEWNEPRMDTPWPSKSKNVLLLQTEIIKQGTSIPTRYAVNIL